MAQDTDEPPGTSRLFRIFVIFMLVSKCTGLPAKVTNLSVVRYDRDGMAEIEFEFISDFDLKLKTLEFAVNLIKCTPPFLAQTFVNISEYTHDVTHLYADIPTSNLTQLNRTFTICVRVNSMDWTREGKLYFPAENSNFYFLPGFDGSDGFESGSDGLERGSDGFDEDEKDEVITSSESELVIGSPENLEPWEEEEDKKDKWKEEMEGEMEKEEVWMTVKRVRRQDIETFNNIKVLSMSLANTSSQVSYTENGRITALESADIHLYLMGNNLPDNATIKFTTSRQEYGDKCGYESQRHSSTIQFMVTTDADGYWRTYIPAWSMKFYAEESTYYLCVQDPTSGEFVHQGENKFLQIEVYSRLLPIWLSIVLLVILLFLSGLFSGLNLGLMSLDQTELRIVQSTGSDKEKAYAKAIMPIRGMGNFLLCSILLGNVLVNNTLTVLLDTLTGGGGVVAVIGATLGIVIFGEIIPQAVCSRHGLAVGANTIWLTKFFMLVTSPLSFPISMILDKILGAEIGTVYNRERLMELIKVTDAYTDLEKDEVNIVTGALVLKRKTVKDVMTRLDDCYMLPLGTILNFETVSEIKEQGYSRIPVYEGDRTNVIHILFAKDLLFIDPEDNKPLEEICKFYKNDVNFVYQDTILTDMFDEFKSGDKGHMALVQEANTEGDGDPYYETIGLLTLEDIIEEIIQQEINDETDVVLDNKTKKKRKKERKTTKDADFRMFLECKNRRVTITPHLSLAILQFLTTSVKAFSGEVISARILQKLLSMDVYRQIKLKKKNEDKKEKMVEKVEKEEGIIMTKGKPCDFFVLILEGRVQVTIGKEDHKFIEGPFTTFCEQMLEQAMQMPSSPMVPDPVRGTSQSPSMPSAVNEIASGKTLKKTSTQILLDTTGSSKRMGSTDSVARSHAWVPDYTVKATTDVLFLKIRKATYMVALKASRMNNMNSEQDGYNERELDYALERMTEDDHDVYDQEFTRNVRSPEKGDYGSNPGTPVIRRESLRSSLSMMKNRFLGGQLGGRSTTSIDKSSSKDEFWDGMTNPAMDHTGTEDPREDFVFLNNSNGSAHVGAAYLNQQSNSGPVTTTELETETSGPNSLPLTLTKDAPLEKQSSEPNFKAGGATRGGADIRPTVINVRGSGSGDAESSGAEQSLETTTTYPSDRTSLLRDKTVS